MTDPEGYMVVLTGNGKGKTTSALGMAMRAVGQGLKVIMLQFLSAIAYGLLPVEDVLKTLKEKPEAVHVVLTGRGVRPDIVEIADLVTECVEIKHPYMNGEKARKGIEY